MGDVNRLNGHPMAEIQHFGRLMVWNLKIQCFDNTGSILDWFSIVKVQLINFTQI